MVGECRLVLVLPEVIDPFLLISAVAEKPGSDIIHRLMEKKQRNHLEAMAQLYRDLSVLSVVGTLYSQRCQV
jgi:hypothetical protein